jgi:hypothetical protein
MTVGAAGSVKSRAVALTEADPRASREVAPEASLAHVADRGLQAAHGVQKAALDLAREVVPAPAVARVHPRKADLDPEAVLLNQIRVGLGLEVERPRAKSRTAGVHVMY